MSDPFNTPVPDELSSIINVTSVYNQPVPKESSTNTLSSPTVQVPDELNNLVNSKDSLALKSNSYSLTDLENDEEFNKTAARFLQSVGEKSLYGKDEDIFEYLRDSDWSLGSALTRSMEVNNWTEQEKNDYRYLRDKFDNSDITSLKHRLKAITNVTSDIIFDPFTLAAVLATPFTGGQSLTGRVVAGKAAQTSLKELTRHQIASQAGKYVAVEGMAWEGAHNYFNQKLNTKLGLQGAGIDVLSVAGSAATGGVLGGAVGYGISRAAPILGKGLQETKRFLNKTFKYSNEQDVIKEGAKPREEVLKEHRLDNVHYGRGPIGTAAEYLVEKPTTKFIRYAKGSKTLQDLLSRFRYDWDSAILPLEASTTPSKTLKTRKANRVRGKSYGLAQAERQYGYITPMRQALQTLDRGGFMANVSTTDNNLLWHLLTNPKQTKYQGKTIPKHIIKTSKELKSLLDIGFTDGLKAKVFTAGQKIKSYLPRRFNHSQVNANRSELEGYIIEYGYADPKIEYSSKDYITGVDAMGKEREILSNEALPIDIDSFGVNFETLAGGNLDDARQLKAEAIVDNMLEFKYTPFDFLNRSKRMGGGYGFMRTRVFDKIPDEKLAPFLDTNVESILTDYFTHLSQAVERSNFFGKNPDEFNERFLVKIREELRTSGMPKTEIKKLETDLSTMYGRVTGVEVPRINNKVGGAASEWGRLANQMAHLSLATLSSVTEPLILLSRVGVKDSPLVVKDVAKALAQGTGKMLDRSLQTIKRTAGKPFGYTQKGSQAFKDLDDETWSEVYKVGLSMEQAVMDRIEGMYGDAFESKGARFLQNTFFQANILTQWTGAVQLASFTTGKRLITENLGKLYRHNTKENVLSKSKYNLLRDQLWELGVDDQLGVKWYKNSLKNNELDYSKSTTGSNKYFYDNHVSSGASRFTKEIILNPNTAEANRPLWFSHPAGQILMQFVGYPTVFNNTVLKKFAQNLTTQQAPETLATVLLMTGGAVIGNAIRSDGKSLEKPDGEIIADAVQRWGGLGPLEYGKRFQINAEYGGGMFGALAKLPPGAIPQDLVDSVLYRQGLAEVGTKNLPGYSAYDFAFGEGTRKELVEDARDYDSEIARALGWKPPVLKEGEFVQSGEAIRAGNAKGGLVYNVLNVHPEPDEVKIRGVNATYNDVAGIVLQDEEDRKTFASGALVRLAKPFFNNIGKEVIDLTKYVTNEISKAPPPFKSTQDEPLSYLSDVDAKDFNNKSYSMTTDTYLRPMVKNPTDYDHLADFYLNRNPGVTLFNTRSPTSDQAEEIIDTDVDYKNLEMVEGVLRLKNPFKIDSKLFDERDGSESTNQFIKKVFALKLPKQMFYRSQYMGDAIANFGKIVRKNKNLRRLQQRQVDEGEGFDDIKRFDDPNYFKTGQKNYSMRTENEMTDFFDTLLSQAKQNKGFVGLTNRFLEINRAVADAPSPQTADVDIFDQTQMAEVVPINKLNKFFKDMEDFDAIYQDSLKLLDQKIDKLPAKTKKDLPFLTDDEITNGLRGPEAARIYEDKNLLNNVGSVYQSYKIKDLLEGLGFDGYTILDPNNLDSDIMAQVFNPSQFKAIGKSSMLPKEMPTQTELGFVKETPLYNIRNYLPVFSDSINSLEKANLPNQMDLNTATDRVKSLPGLKAVEKNKIIEVLQQMEIDYRLEEPADQYDGPNKVYTKDLLRMIMESNSNEFMGLTVKTQKTPSYFSAFVAEDSSRELVEQLDPKMHIIKGGYKIRDLVEEYENSLDESLREIVNERQMAHTMEADSISFAIRSKRKDKNNTEGYVIDQLQTDLNPIAKELPFKEALFKFPVYSVLKEAAQNNIKQVSLVDPISVMSIESIGLSTSKANAIYSTPKFLEMFPVSKESLTIGTNKKKGLGYLAFESIIKDLGEDPTKVLSYKKYPNFGVKGYVPKDDPPIKYAKVNEDGEAVVSFASSEGARTPSNEEGFTKDFDINRFMELRKKYRMTASGPKPIDPNLNKEFVMAGKNNKLNTPKILDMIEELVEFKQLSKKVADNNEGSVQTKYSLEPNWDIGDPDTFIPNEGFVNESGPDDYLGDIGGLFTQDIPLLTITLTDEMIKKLLEDTAPIRMSKVTGGLVNRMIERKRK